MSNNINTADNDASNDDRLSTVCDFRSDHKQSPVTPAGEQSARCEADDSNPSEASMSDNIKKTADNDPSNDDRLSTMCVLRSDSPTTPSFFADTNPVLRQPACETDETNVTEKMMNNTTTSKKTDAARPDNTWTLKTLEKYALARATEIHGFGRKTLTQTWLFDEALSLIEKIKKEEKTWVKWVKTTQPYSLSTATNAI